MRRRAAVPPTHAGMAGPPANASCRSEGIGPLPLVAGVETRGSERCVMMGCHCWLVPILFGTRFAPGVLLSWISAKLSRKQGLNLSSRGSCTYDQSFEQAGSFG